MGHKHIDGWTYIYIYIHIVITHHYQIIKYLFKLIHFVDHIYIDR